MPLRECAALAADVQHGALHKVAEPAALSLGNVCALILGKWPGLPQSVRALLAPPCICQSRNHASAQHPLIEFFPALCLQENPIPEGTDQIGFDEPLPEAPTYAAYVDPIKKNAAFEQLDKLFEERICFIDGAMGTSIQGYKLDEEDYRGERYKVRVVLQDFAGAMP